jgi:predicted HicB family RNase H-like nuclease
LSGCLASINDVIGFQADNGREPMAAFHEADDDYLAPAQKQTSHPRSPETLFWQGDVPDRPGGSRPGPT